MTYRMNIVSGESVEVYSNQSKQYIKLEVGNKYIVHFEKPLSKEKKNQDREVELLGFIDDFMPEDAIVRYLDNNRRGRIRVNSLLPYNE